jgi:hypothetical protein
MAVKAKKKSAAGRAKVKKTGEQILLNAAKHLVQSSGLKFEQPDVSDADIASMFVLDEEQALITEQERELFLALRLIISVINNRTLPVTTADIEAAIETVFWGNEDWDNWDNDDMLTAEDAAQTAIEIQQRLASKLSTLTPVRVTAVQEVPTKITLWQKFLNFVRSNPFS